MKILVGNTGLVGSTLKQNISFTEEFNSNNINSFQEIVPDYSELWLSCLPASKWLVNQNLGSDFQNMMRIIDLIKHKTYSKVILISTIDVYNDSPLYVDESYKPNIGKLSYGNNRLIFEKLVNLYVKTEQLKIYRLPALFNRKIKKNILFDLLNNNNVENININSAYQWYNLDSLYGFIRDTESSEMEVINVFTEPIETKEIVEFFPQHKNKVKNTNPRVIYDYKTKLFENGYINDKETTLKEIKNFIDEFNHK